MVEEDAQVFQFKLGELDICKIFKTHCNARKFATFFEVLDKSVLRKYKFVTSMNDYDDLSN